MSPRRWLDRIGFAGLTGGVLLSGYFQGLVALSLRIELTFGLLAIALLEATISNVMFAAFILVSSTIFIYQLTVGRTNVAPTHDGGTITAIVPVYGDADVLHRSVDSLLSANYENLDILIVTEEDDAASRERAKAFADRHDAVSWLENTRYPGSKAGAINYAAEVTESAFLAVFDADEIVNPAFLPHGVSLLADNDIVQGRTIPQPTGLIESLAYYESVLLSFAGWRLLYVLTGFRMAVSRAIVMRREAYEAVGGYDTTMLTEDFEFACSCYRERLEVVEYLDHPSKIDAAHNVQDWWGQRKRWMTGYAQVSHRMLTSVNPGDYRSVLLALMCVGSVMGPAMLLSVVSKFAALLAANAQEVVTLSLFSEYSLHYVVGSYAVLLLPVLAILVVTALIHFHDYAIGGLEDFGWYWILVPLAFPLYGFVALKAVFEYVLSWQGEWYSVEKDPGNV